MDTITGYIGDSSQWAVALTHPVTGAAFSPGGSYGLVATFKRRENDPDSLAVIQKATGAGITVSGSTATITLVREDTEGFCESNLHFGIRATHATTGESLTVAEKRVRLEKPTTLETTTSVDVVTTETPLPFGGVTSYVDEIETLPDYPATFPPASHTHVSANITDASEGGNGEDDTGKLVKFAGGGSLFASQISAYIEELGSPALIADSLNGTSLLVYATNADLFAQFSGTGNNNAFIARIDGAFGWVRGSYSGRITAAGTITANRTYTLPDASGTIALLSGNQTFTGQIELSGQAATNATSAMTRGLGDTRYGAITSSVLATDQTVSSGTYAAVSGIGVALEANSVYEVFSVVTAVSTGGTPTTNRFQVRFAYSGTLNATNGGSHSSTQSNGSYFSNGIGTILSTIIADVSNTDRDFTSQGIIRTVNAGTLGYEAYKIQGSSNPTIRAGTILYVRKLA